MYRYSKDIWRDSGFAGTTSVEGERNSVGELAVEPKRTLEL